MKKQALILLIFLLSTFSSKCFAVDPSPYGYIVINKSLASEIDSIIIYSKQNQYVGERFFRVKLAEGETEFSPHFRLIDAQIKLKLKNSQEVNSDTISVYGFNNKINIYRKKGQIIFDDKPHTDFIQLGWYFLFMLLILLVTKLPIALSLILPKNKKEFIIRFGLINLFYLALIIVPFILSSHPFLKLILFIFPIIVLILDVNLLSKYNSKGFIRVILALILSNIIFFIVGLISLFLIVMIN